MLDAEFAYQEDAGDNPTDYSATYYWIEPKVLHLRSRRANKPRYPSLISSNHHLNKTEIPSAKK